MTKKHFEAIARVLARYYKELEHPYVIEDIAISLAREFANANPRFDQAKFVAACRGERV